MSNAKNPSATALPDTQNLPSRYCLLRPRPIMDWQNTRRLVTPAGERTVCAQPGNQPRFGEGKHGSMEYEKGCGRIGHNA